MTSRPPGLDPTNTRRINELIVGLQKKLGVSSLVITHDMASALAVSDRVALLEGGRIVVEVDAKEARKNPPSSFDSSCAEKVRMNKDRSLEVKVGLFVVLVAVVAVVAVMLLGKSRHVFEQRAKLHATFNDVAGLVQGAPVRISGVNVGTVSQIMFVRAQRRPLIQVNMQITLSSLGLVRADSVARISSQGLLGDKIIEISAGSTASAAVASGGEIQTAESPDLDSMLRQTGAVLDDARKVADRLAVAVDQFADAKTIGAMRESMLHIHGLLHQADKGRGLAHSLFYDERTSDEIDRLLASLNRVARARRSRRRAHRQRARRHRRRRAAGAQQRLARGQERGHGRRAHRRLRTEDSNTADRALSSRSSPTSSMRPAIWRR